MNKIIKKITNIFKSDNSFTFIIDSLDKDFKFSMVMFDGYGKAKEVAIKEKKILISITKNKKGLLWEYKGQIYSENKYNFNQVHIFIYELIKESFCLMEMIKKNDLSEKWDFNKFHISHFKNNIEDLKLFYGNCSIIRNTLN